jgi:hypothetical protein
MFSLSVIEGHLIPGREVTHSDIKGKYSNANYKHE